jgi:hypothetical protein
MLTFLKLSILYKDHAIAQIKERASRALMDSDHLRAPVSLSGIVVKKNGPQTFVQMTSMDWYLQLALKIVTFYTGLFQSFCWPSQ